MHQNDSLSFEGSDSANQEAVARLLAELGTRLLNDGVHEVVVALDAFTTPPVSAHSHSHGQNCRCIKPAGAVQATVSVSFRLKSPDIEIPLPTERSVREAPFPMPLGSITSMKIGNLSAAASDLDAATKTFIDGLNKPRYR